MRTKEPQFRLTSQETKAEATTRIAREILRSEAEERQNKTAALKAARLARQAAGDAAPVAPKSRKATLPGS
ncbi:hypothetical protein [Rhodovulum sp.]|uniref:hypothetical protein n=1 Tax=Rhodovulum sp. TaxID=34009 RepID=UPI0017CE77DF|nr:hypothetical protein [Rhodovulum sp.]HDR27459.1 hypothetical protein [Rhodovulum sp.]